MQDKPITSIYSLLDADEQQRRLALLHASHIAPLTEYVTNLRASLGYGREIPYFDPKDGGINARILFLLEAPGPKAVSSGFISRDNPDPTAKNMTILLSESNVPRKETISWNIVPRYIGIGGRIRPVDQDEIRAGFESLRSLRPLLPNIRVVVLLGEKAQKECISIKELFHTHVLACPHPGNRVLNRWPEKREEIKAVFKEAMRLSLDGK